MLSINIKYILISKYTCISFFYHKYKYTTSISYYIIIYILYVCLNIHNSKIYKNLSLFCPSNLNANIEIIKNKGTIYLGDFLHFLRDKVGIVNVLFKFFQHSIWNAVFIICLEILQEVGVSQKHLGRLPICSVGAKKNYIIINFSGYNQSIDQQAKQHRITSCSILNYLVPKV